MTVAQIEANAYARSIVATYDDPGAGAAVQADWAARFGELGTADPASAADFAGRTMAALATIAYRALHMLAERTASDLGTVRAELLTALAAAEGT